LCASIKSWRRWTVNSVKRN